MTFFLKIFLKPHPLIFYMKSFCIFSATVLINSPPNMMAFVYCFGLVYKLIYIHIYIFMYTLYFSLLYALQLSKRFIDQSLHCLVMHTAELKKVKCKKIIRKLQKDIVGLNNCFAPSKNGYFTILGLV